MKTRNMIAAMLLVMTMGANAQEHQTYSGQFGKNNAGTATYSYYTGEDGRRMFDGKYTYKKTVNQTGNSASYTETGQYKDDRLDGLWTIVFSSKSYESVTLNVKMNYKNGVLHGPLTYVKKVIEDGKVTENTNLTLQFHEGYLTGKNNNIKLDMKRFSYEFDENNLPHGLWKYRLDRKQEEYVYCMRYDHGKFVEAYHEKISTGDRFDDGNTDLFVGHELINEILNLLTDPYSFKEMPIRSSLTKEQQMINSRALFDKNNFFGFLCYPGYGNIHK
jgi:hypothetical protein